MAAAAAAAMRGVGALGIMRGSAGAGDRHPLGGACSDVSVKVKSPHSSTAPASTIQYTMCARTYSGFVEVRTKGSVTVNPQKRNFLLVVTRCSDNSTNPSLSAAPVKHESFLHG